MASSGTQTPRVTCQGRALKPISLSHPNTQALGSRGAWQWCAGGDSQEPLLLVWRIGPQHCCTAGRPTPQDLRRAADLWFWVFRSRASGVPRSPRRCHWHLEGSTFMGEVQSFSFLWGVVLKSSLMSWENTHWGLGKTPTPVYHSSNSLPISKIPSVSTRINTNRPTPTSLILAS